MKGFLLILFCLTITISLAAQPTERATLEFKIDKRLETLYFVYLLADYPLITRFDNAYKADAITYFAPHKDHKAVTLTRNLMERGFATDYAVNWIFQFSDFPEFKKNRWIDFPFDARPLNADSMSMLQKELINFYNEAKCETFFAREKDFLDAMVRDVRDSFTRKDIIDVITSYFGVTTEATFQVVLSPLLHSGGYSVERKDKKEISALVGPGSAKDGRPVFDKVLLEQDLVIHEFSHIFANRVVEIYEPQAEHLEAKIYPQVKEMTAEEGYASYESFMMELIVRATTIRIVEGVYGKEAAQELIDYEKSVGFGYVVDIGEELANYEKQRDKYRTFFDFYPVIITRLEKVGD
jgi:hypothetical protein